MSYLDLGRNKMTTKKSIEEQPAHPVPVLSRHPQEPFSKSAPRFPNLRRVFQICDAFSKSATRFPNLRRVSQICDAFSRSATPWLSTLRPFSATVPVQPDPVTHRR